MRRSSARRTRGRCRMPRRAGGSDRRRCTARRALGATKDPSTKNGTAQQAARRIDELRHEAREHDGDLRVGEVARLRPGEHRARRRPGAAAGARVWRPAVRSASMPSQTRYGAACELQHGERDRRHMDRAGDAERRRHRPDGAGPVQTPSAVASAAPRPNSSALRVTSAVSGPGTTIHDDHDRERTPRGASGRLHQDRGAGWPARSGCSKPRRRLLKAIAPTSSGSQNRIRR